MSKRRKKEKRAKKEMPPGAYNTMPHYYPTEQIDIVKKMKSRKQRKKK